MPTTSVSVVRAGCLLIGMLASVGCDIILGIEPPRARVAVEGSGGDGGNPSGEDGGSPTAEAGSDPGVHAGQAGTTSGGMAGGATGGSHGGTVATGGSGGSDPPPELTIDVGDLPVACSGQGVTVQLTADGGTAPYTWSLLEPASGFELSGDGSTATLSGTAEAAGVQILHVVVTDDEGLPTEREVELTTHQTPVIESLTLPSVCPNEIYRAELVASGGNKANYEWTTTLPEDTGLRVASNFLEGKLTREPDDARRIDFTVTVDDGQCSASTPATLPLDAPTARACAAISVVGALPSEPPREPCSGEAYRTQLLVRRGAGEFTWQASSLPEGLSFDPATQIVSGVPRSEGELTVQVTDVQHRTVEQSYSLRPRDKCWLAYVAPAAGSARVQLFDPWLESRRSLPAADSAEPVIDFKFSPDGRLLAYRTGALAVPARVSIVELATWAEQRIDATGVNYYAWSNDSTVLAVAFTTPGGTFMGGAHVRTADTLGGSAEAKLELSEFVPLPTAVDAEPVWVSDDRLAFMTLNEHSALLLTTAQRRAQGFAELHVDSKTGYIPTPRIMPAPGGLFMVPQLGVMQFYPADGAVPVLHRNVFLSPSGRYAARVQPDADGADTALLALFRSDMDSSFRESASGYAHAARCRTLLTWARNRERFACANVTGGDTNEVLVFDVVEGTPELLSEVRGDFDYPSGAQFQRRRLFSPSGNRLALTTNDAFILGILDNGTPVGISVVTHRDESSTANMFADLSFAPDESMLLQRRGSRLSVFNFDDLTMGEHVISEALAPSVRCEEDFRDQNGGWCGAEGPQVPFMWSHDSNFAAFQTADGALHVFDLTRRTARHFSSTAVTESCGAGCTVGDTQARFQP